MATYGDSTAEYGEGVRQFDGNIDSLELVVRNVEWKGEDFVGTDEIDNCNTAVNDALDGVANLDFDGVETINIHNDETAST